MVKRVAIVGIGTTGFRPVTPDVSYRELIFEAARKAYTDAGIEPSEIDGFITTAEDFMEGYSIADEYCPDQIGSVLKPTQTIPGDFLQGLATGYMMIMTGAFKTVAVEAHSKVSNVKNVGELMGFAQDPVYNRPLRETPHAIAGLEMTRYLFETQTTPEHCASVVVKNKWNALRNPYAAFGADITEIDVLSSEPVALPLQRLDIAPHADGAVVVVLAAEETAHALCDIPIWIEGLGWCTDTPTLEMRDWGQAGYARLSAEMAYRMAGIANPPGMIDFAEICDEYSYKELQHMEALKLCKPGEAAAMLESGATSYQGELPVNISGGALGVGHLFEASGAHKILELVEQLRGEAGARQIPDVNIGLAQVWRGVPTATGAVAILSNM
ncbi:MAG: acetyl-CoA acetyltransferase [Candidatus Krumholzibacteriota bacterium]|nr:acetyl-CoA acetyltransferase [Candidatus Krumholzibacteriota bacterium]